MSPQILVTPAPPYSNNYLHLGHLYSTYLPADVYARWSRLQGKNVRFLGGSDDFGTPVLVQAEIEGNTAEGISEYYANCHKDDLASSNISLDSFSRTSNDRHYQVVSEIFKRLANNGYIEAKEVSVLKCPSCGISTQALETPEQDIPGRYLSDRFVRGKCPKCHKDAMGDQCESCGAQFEAHELIEPKCVFCQKSPVITTDRHWFFKLSMLGDQVIDYLKTSDESVIQQLVKRVEKEGLVDIDITRNLNWGVPIPDEDAEGKSLYMIFDGCCFLLSFLAMDLDLNGENKNGEWEQVWSSVEDVRYFFGRDVAYIITTLGGGIYAGLNMRQPKVVVSGFLNLQGSKMSKSQNKFIRLRDIFEKVEPDFVRFYLASLHAGERDVNFDFDDLIWFVNHRLLKGIIRPLVTAWDDNKYELRCCNKAHIPDALVRRIESCDREMTQAMNRPDLNKLVDAIENYVYLATECLNSQIEGREWVFVSAIQSLGLLAPDIAARLLVSSGISYTDSETFLMTGLSRIEEVVFDPSECCIGDAIPGPISINDFANLAGFEKVEKNYANV